MMRPLSAVELLSIWEEGIDQPLFEKTQRLLAKACSVANYDDIGLLSIGERDARLLQLREWLFGTRLMNMANCPKCGEQVEWETNTGGLHLQLLPADLAVRSYSLNKDDFSIQFRLPNTHDITGTMYDTPKPDFQNKILTDCIVEVKKKGKKFRGKNLPDKILDALSSRMEEEDPQADISMRIDCPACSHKWEARFDIVRFLWAEIHNWAQHIMQEVFVLAKSFGWSENDILNMSPRRRQLYLQMVGA
jgi:hypothetical protein